MIRPWNKLVYGFAWAVILSALLLIGTMTYWIAYPYNGLSGVTNPVKTNQAQVYQGGLLTYDISYCVDEKLPLPITVVREMELQGPDGMIFPIAPTIGYEIKHRCETRKLAIGIPIYQPVGVYHIHFMTALEVNPIRQIKQSFVSTDFTVIENPNLKPMEPIFKQ